MTSLFFFSNSVLVASSFASSGFACWASVEGVDSSLFFSASVDCHLRPTRDGRYAGVVDLIAVKDAEENGDRLVWGSDVKDSEMIRDWRKSCFLSMVGM